jgi:hypothetical protein
MEKEKVMMAPAPVPRVVIKHSVIGSRAMNQYVSVFSDCNIHEHTLMIFTCVLLMSV